MDFRQNHVANSKPMLRNVRQRKSKRSRTKTRMNETYSGCHLEAINHTCVIHVPNVVTVI